MQYTNETSGTVEVDGEIYVWGLRRQPRPVGKREWEGMAITLRHQDYKREAIVEFPMVYRPNGSPDLEKQKVDLDVVKTCIRSILEAGWEPASRGKPVNFGVDALGQ
ncbi:hypothetical protein [Brevundimonas sp.]|uniref:hypothetical protein n=1 Tax=Brevundimonas sp. TaxID=1871086 RepID=UPI002FC5902C